MTLGAEGEKEISTTPARQRVHDGRGPELQRTTRAARRTGGGHGSRRDAVVHLFARTAIWFLLLLFFVARPLSVWLGLLGATSVSRDQRILISWLGIRGVGSIFYLMYAINHGCRRLWRTS